MLWLILILCLTGRALGQHDVITVFGNECITNSTSAIVFNEPIPASSYYSYGYYTGSRRNETYYYHRNRNKFLTYCSYELSSSYYSRCIYNASIWDIKNSISGTVPNLITDWRWEGFETYYTPHQMKLFFMDVLNLKNNYFEVPVSIRAKQEAHIYLCDNKNPIDGSCYWILIGAFYGNITGLRKCDVGYIKSNFIDWPRSPCKDILATSSSNMNPILNENVWRHFKVIMENNEITLKYGDEVLFKYVDKTDKVYAVTNFIIHTKRVPGLWKIHQYNFLYTEYETTDVLFDNFKLQDNNCIAMFVIMCKDCHLKIDFVTKSKQRLVHTETVRTESTEWKEIKIVFKDDITFDLETIQMNVTTAITNSYKNGFWAIDEIRDCVFGDYRRIYSKTMASVPCQDVSSELTVRVSEDSIINGDTLLGCDDYSLGEQCVTCKQFFSEEDEFCPKGKYCQLNTFTNKTTCFCAAGYTGDQCESECSHGYYGYNCSNFCINCDKQMCNLHGLCLSFCINGYKGEKCDIGTLLIFKFPPVVINVTHTTCTVRIENFDVIGIEEPQLYVIQYRKGNDFWVTSEGKRYHFHNLKNIVIQNLDVDADYSVRSVIISKIPYTANNIPIATFHTTCNILRQDQIVMVKLTDTTASLTFKNFSRQDCNIDNYKIVNQIFNDNRINSGACSKFIFIINCNNLKPFTEYTVEIRHKYMEVSVNYTFKTLDGAPSEVTDFWRVAYNDKKIYFRWLPPNPPNGRLDLYRMRCVDNSSSQTYIFAPVKCKLWPNYHCGQILFNSSTSGNCTLKARNLYSSYNKGLTVLMPVTTTVKYQGKPYDVSSSWNDNGELELSWKHPNFTNGLLTKFLIDLNIMDVIHHYTYQIRSEEDYKSMYFYVISNISYSFCTTYGLKISAANSKYSSDWSAVMNNVPPPKPKFVYHIDVKETHASLSVSFENDNKYHANIFISVSDTNETMNDMATDSLLHVVYETNKFPFTFVIGNNDSSKSVYFNSDLLNPPLKPGRLYNVGLLVVNRCNKKTLSTFKTTTIYTQANTSVLHTGLYIVIIILGLVLIIIGIVVYYKRRSRSNLENIRPLMNIDDDVTRRDSLRLYDELQAYCSRVINATELESYTKTSIANGELKQQFSLLPTGQTNPREYGLLLQNKSKNRFANIIAYDHTRVKLAKLDNEPYSDYINANYVDGYKIDKAYIATQIPKSSTVSDFWRMIWQENVLNIIMLSGTVLKKGEKYWPNENQEMTFNGIVVKFVSSELYASFEHRIFQLVFNNIQREVKQLQFKSWPDQGIPRSLQNVTVFMQRILQIPNDPKSPILIQSSAGSGRTGTIILCDICLRMAIFEGCVDFFNNLQNMRFQRPQMVYKFEQYKFAHLVVADCLATMKNIVKDMSRNNPSAPLYDTPCEPCDV